MKVMMVIDTLQFGGAEKQLIFDANALSQSGHEVLVVSFCGGDLEKELREGVTCVQIKEKGYPRRARALARLARDNRVDIIHAHMFRAEVASGLAALYSRTPVVFNEHGLGLWRKLPHRVLFRFVARVAREIWCASDFCRDLRVTFDKLPQAKCQTVYNAYTPFKEWDFDVQALRSDFFGESASDAVVIGFVGRFDHVKQLDLLVKAAATLGDANVHFVLVGDGMEMDAIKKQIGGLGLEDRFLLPGFVHNPSQYFAVFDAFVLPSKRESLSLALLEAGSCGVPSIAFDVGGNAEIIDHGKTGLVVADQTVDALAGAIRQLVDDPTLRKESGVRASERVRQMFSGEQRVNNLLDGYNRILAERAG